MRVKVSVTVEDAGNISKEQIEEMAEKMTEAIRGVANKYMDKADRNDSEIFIFPPRNADDMERIMAGMAERAASITPEQMAEMLGWSRLKQNLENHPGFDEYGTTLGCDCENCEERRKRNADMPNILTKLRLCSIASGDPKVLELEDFKKYVPEWMEESVAIYMAWSDAWEIEKNEIVYVGE